jgi:CSLREA domain-containing protein
MSITNRSFRCLFVLLILLVLFIEGAVHVSPVSANTITVDTTEDQNHTDLEHCSLREALIAATLDAAYYGCDAGSGADIISLPAGEYTIDSQLSAIESDITINGVDPATTIIQASSCNPVEESCTNDHQLLQIGSSGILTLNNLTLRYWKNVYDLNGGAILNQGTLNIADSILTNNRGLLGGVIKNNDGTISIINSTFSGNIAEKDADLMSGGAINNTAAGIVNIENSTFSGNSAKNGGAIFNFGTVEIINSTFSGNTAESGGAIDNVGGAVVTLTNTTISGNTGTTGAGIHNDDGSFLNFTNTIITNSVTGSDCNNSGLISTNVSNLVEDGSCSAAYSGDPSLGALADNGGSTQTHALLMGSTAIDAGNLAACPATDQRGVTRPKGSGCDIGAFEFFPAAADLTGAPTSGTAPLEVDFTNNSTGDYDTCLWDFGDTTTSSVCDPSPHTYADAGVYTVSLTVSGLGGSDTQTREDYITVEELPEHENFLPLFVK